MKRRSSLRTTLAPMPSTPMSCPPDRSYCFRHFHRNAVFNSKNAVLRLLFCRLRNLHTAGRIEHRFDDVVVPGAAADVAFQLVPDGRLVEVAAMAMHNIDRRHDHARGAVTALQAVIVAERRLHRVQFVAFCDALDGGDVRARGLAGQHSAGLYGTAIDMDDAGAALAGVAADMGAGQVQIFAQEMDEKGPVFDFSRDGLAVHGQFDCRHAWYLPRFCNYSN